MAKAIHIIGVISGFAAGAILTIVGIVNAVSSAAESVAPGKYICWGIAGLACAVVATADGARAVPQLGIWKIGAKWEGLGDLATLIILAILGAGIGISFAFK